MWPDYFPKQCPPADARQDELTVFRLVSNCPPVREDFLPTVIEYPHRDFSEDQICLACGVSVFKNKSDILKKKNRYAPLKAKKIAQGTIQASDGLVKETGQHSHITWWLQTDQPHSAFQEVADVAG